VTDFCLHYTLEQQNSHNSVDTKHEQQAVLWHLHTKDHAWKLAEPVTSLTLSGGACFDLRQENDSTDIFRGFNLSPQDSARTTLQHKRFFN